MKTKLCYAGLLILIILSVTACKNKKKTVVQAEEVKVDTATLITENIRFCESTLWYDTALLIANFGTEELNPLNDEGKGYILIYKNGKTDTLIAPDGTLSAPKGLGVYGESLFICDVNKIVKYNLADQKEAPVVMRFPEGELFVNDLIIIEDKLYVTVTNTGNIYTLSITAPEEGFKLYTNIPGANGIVTDGTKIYVVSYPADGVTKDENVIYVIHDVKNPQPEKLIERVGQYDGAVLSGDNLYFSSWIDGEVGKINLTTHEVTLIPVTEKMIGPADMSLHNGKLYIPDLPNSKVVVVEVEKKK